VPSGGSNPAAFFWRNVLNNDTLASEAKLASDLNAAALRALAARDYATAAQLLRQALGLESRNTTLWLNLAAALRGNGDIADALTVLDKALSIDPRLFFALLMKGSLLDAHGQLREAALVYGQALSVAPRQERLDQATQRAVQRAREVNRKFVLELREQVASVLTNVSSEASHAERMRAMLFLDHLLGIKRIYRQEPTHYHYPGLQAIEFYEREEFPWIAALEAGTEVMQAELRQVLGGDEGFRPYVEYPPGTPVDQWAELNGSRRWSAFHFYHQGNRHAENCARCPQTVSILESLGQPQVVNYMPAAMFSVLAPGTRLPPHHGVANVRLVVHLPLIVPPGCGFRVGNQTRQWEVGKALVFDDTIEHEAWNDSSDIRGILIFDIWSPRLGLQERRLVTSIMETIDRMMPNKPSLAL
jgi:aspartyl/asparaginyl beta-hydroxylase (cupin superfamily)